MKLNYYHKPETGPIFCLHGVYENGELRIGFSACSEEDRPRFSQKKANMIAEGRAEKRPLAILKGSKITKTEDLREILKNYVTPALRVWQQDHETKKRHLARV